MICGRSSAPRWSMPNTTCSAATFRRSMASARIASTSPASSSGRGTGTVKEVLLALNATVEGQSTAHYLTEQLAPTGVAVSRLAQGVPVGGELDYLDEGTLAAAIKARKSLTDLAQSWDTRLMDALPDAPLITHPPPKFVTGSLLRHILVMSGAGGIGLVAIFLADLANILFLSWLNDEAVVAAAGYASSILFFTTSVGIGLSIAASSLVSPALGAGNRAAARRLSVNAHLAALVVSVVFAIIIWLAIPWLMTLLGATGRAHSLGTSYLSILMPSTPLLSLAITSAAVLRSAGDAGRAMSVTLWGAVANAILDPILIFGFDLGIEGAAYATTIARFVFTGVGLYGVIRVHDLMSRPRLPVLPRRCPAGDEDCRPRHPHQCRDTRVERLRHRSDRRLRRRCRGRLGHHRTRHARGLRRGLCAVRIDRSHHRPEFRRRLP